MLLLSDISKNHATITMATTAQDGFNSSVGSTTESRSLSLVFFPKYVSLLALQLSTALPHYFPHRPELPLLLNISKKLAVLTMVALHSNWSELLCRELCKCLILLTCILFSYMILSPLYSSLLFFNTIYHFVRKCSRSPIFSKTRLPSPWLLSSQTGWTLSVVSLTGGWPFLRILSSHTCVFCCLKFLLTVLRHSFYWFSNYSCTLSLQAKVLLLVWIAAILTGRNHALSSSSYTSSDW